MLLCIIQYVICKQQHNAIRNSVKAYGGSGEILDLVKKKAFFFFAPQKYEVSIVYPPEQHIGWVQSFTLENHQQLLNRNIYWQVSMLRCSISSGLEIRLLISFYIFNQDITTWADKLSREKHHSFFISNLIRKFYSRKFEEPVGSAYSKNDSQMPKSRSGFDKSMLFLQPLFKPGSCKRHFCKLWSQQEICHSSHQCKSDQNT